MSLKRLFFLIFLTSFLFVPIFGAVPFIDLIDIKGPIALDSDVCVDVSFKDLDNDVGEIFVEWKIDGESVLTSSLDQVNSQEVVRFNLSKSFFKGGEEVLVSAWVKANMDLSDKKDYNREIYSKELDNFANSRSVFCDDDFCFVGDNAGNLKKIDKDFGEVKWSVSLGDGFIFDIDCNDQICMAALGSNGHVLEVQKENGVYNSYSALDRNVFSVDCDDDLCVVGGLGEVANVDYKTDSVLGVYPISSGLIRGLVCDEDVCFTGQGSGIAVKFLREDFSVVWNKTFDSNFNFWDLDCDNNFCFGVGDYNGVSGKFFKFLKQDGSLLGNSQLNEKLYNIDCDSKIGCFVSGESDIFRQINFDLTQEFALENSGSYLDCDSSYCFLGDGDSNFKKFSKFASFEYPKFGCGVLDIPNKVYFLEDDLHSDGTCFKVRADNVTIEGNNHTIFFGEDPDDGVDFHGIDIGSSSGFTLNNTRVVNDENFGLVSDFDFYNYNISLTNNFFDCKTNLRRVDNVYLKNNFYSKYMQISTTSKNIFMFDNIFKERVSFLGFTNAQIFNNNFKDMDLTGTINLNMFDNTFYGTLKIFSNPHYLNNTIYNNHFYGDGLAIDNQASSGIEFFKELPNGKRVGNYYKGIEEKGALDTNYDGISDSTFTKVSQSSWTDKWSGYGEDSYPLTKKQISFECGNLTVKDGVYFLQKNLSTDSGHCLIIKNDGITVDGNGFSIFSKNSRFKILAQNFDNLTFKNMIFDSSQDFIHSHGIRIEKSNNLKFFNISSRRGIWDKVFIDFTNVNNVLIENVNYDGSFHHADLYPVLSFKRVNNLTFYNNNLNLSQGKIFLRFLESDNIYLENNNFYSKSKNVGENILSGIDNLTLKNNKFTFNNSKGFNLQNVKNSKFLNNEFVFNSNQTNLFNIFEFNNNVFDSNKFLINGDNLKVFDSFISYKNNFSNNYYQVVGNNSIVFNQESFDTNYLENGFKDGLVAWWSFDNVDQSGVIDDSGNGHKAFFKNGVKMSQVKDGFIDFSTHRGYLDVPSLEGLNFPQEEVSVFIKVGEVGDHNEGLFYSYNENGNNLFLRNYYYNSYSLCQCQISGGCSYDYNLAKNILFSYKKDDFVKYFTNFNLFSKKQVKLASLENQVVELGSNYHDKIYEVIIWDRVLSEDEVKKVASIAYKDENYFKPNKIVNSSFKIEDENSKIFLLKNVKNYNISNNYIDSNSDNIFILDSTYNVSIVNNNISSKSFDVFHFLGNKKENFLDLTKNNQVNLKSLEIEKFYDIENQEIVLDSDNLQIFYNVKNSVVLNQNPKSEVIFIDSENITFKNFSSKANYNGIVFVNCSFVNFVNFNAKAKNYAILNFNSKNFNFTGDLNFLGNGIFSKDSIKNVFNFANFKSFGLLFNVLNSQIDFNSCVLNSTSKTFNFEDNLSKVNFYNCDFNQLYGLNDKNKIHVFDNFNLDFKKDFASSIKLFYELFDFKNNLLVSGFTNSSLNSNLLNSVIDNRAHSVFFSKESLNNFVFDLNNGFLKDFEKTKINRFDSAFSQVENLNDDILGFWNFDVDSSSKITDFSNNYVGEFFGDFKIENNSFKSSQKGFVKVDNFPNFGLNNWSISFRAKGVGEILSKGVNGGFSIKKTKEDELRFSMLGEDFARNGDIVVGDKFIYIADAQKGRIIKKDKQTLEYVGESDYLGYLTSLDYVDGFLYVRYDSKGFLKLDSDFNILKRKKFEEGDGFNQFRNARTISCDSNFCFVVDGVARRIVKLDLDFNWILSYEGQVQDLFDDIYGISVDENFVYISDDDNQNRRVVKLTKDLEFVSQINSSVLSNSFGFDFYEIRDIQEDGNFLYLANRNNKVIRLTKDFSSAQIFLDNEYRVYKLDVDDNLLYLNRYYLGNSQIKIYDVNTKNLVNTIGQLFTDSFMSFYFTKDNTGYYISDYDNSRILKFDNSFKFVKSLGQYGFGIDRFKNPVGITHDEDFIYVLDSQNNRVVKLTKNLEWVSTFGSNGHSVNQFRYPFSIFVDENYLFITDCGNNRIIRVDKADFSNWREIGTKGGQINQFNSSLNSIAGDNNYIYVDDLRNNKRIVKLDKNLNWIESKTFPHGTSEGQFREMVSLHVKGDDLFVSDRYSRKIVKLDKNLNVVSKVMQGVLDIAEKDFIILGNIVSDENYFYVLDPYGVSIQVFDKNWNFVDMWSNEQLNFYLDLDSDDLKNFTINYNKIVDKNLYNLSFFVDGEFFKSFSLPVSYNLNLENDKDLIIGNRLYSNLIIDDVLILNKSLNISQIKDYNNKDLVKFENTNQVLDFTSKSKKSNFNFIDLFVKDFALDSQVFAKIKYKTKLIDYSNSFSDSLELYLPFDTNYSDVTANGFDASHQIEQVNFSKGKAGKSVSFLKNDSIIIIRNSDSDIFKVNDKEEVSFSAWVNLEDIQTNDNRMIIEDDANCIGWWFEIDRSNYLKLVFDTGTSCQNYNQYYVKSQNKIAPKKWNHVVGVIDRNQGFLKIYINGVFEGKTKIEDQDSSNRSNFRIGNSWNLQSKLNGRIDELMFFSKAINEQEVRSLFLDGIGKWEETQEKKLVLDKQKSENLQKGLVGFWDFKTDVLDKSGNENHGRIVGNPEFITLKNSRKILKFDRTDGQNDYVIIKNPIKQNNQKQEWTVSALVEVVKKERPQYLLAYLDGGLKISEGSGLKPQMYMSTNNWQYAESIVDKGLVRLTFVYDFKTNKKLIYINDLLSNGYSLDVNEEPQGFGDDFFIGYSTSALIGDVMIWDRALKSDEIYDLNNLEIDVLTQSFKLKKDARDFKPIIRVLTNDSKKSAGIFNNLFVRARNFQKTNEYILKINDSNYFADDLISTKDSSFDLEKGLSEVKITSSNKKVYKYRTSEQKKIFHTINIESLNSTITNVDLSLVGFTRNFINKSKIIQSCPVIKKGSGCQVKFEFVLNKGLFGESTVNTKIRYRNKNGLFVEKPISFQIQIQDYVELVASPNKLDFSQKNINQEQDIKFNLSNLGSVGTSDLQFEVDNPQISLYVNQITPLNDYIEHTQPITVGQGSTYKGLSARLNINSFEERFERGNITITPMITNEPFYYPYQINVNHSLSLKQIKLNMIPEQNVSFNFEVLNDGNIFLQNINQVEYVPENLHRFWIRFSDKLPLGKFEIGDKFDFNVNISIPKNQAKGDYIGRFIFRGDFGFTHSVLVNISIDDVGNYDFSPKSYNNQEIFLTSYQKAYDLNPIKIENKGNVPLTFKITPFSFIPESGVGFDLNRYHSTNPENITVNVGDTFLFKPKIYSYIDVPDVNKFGLKLNFEVLNQQVNANLRNFDVNYTLRVVDATPQVLSWTNLKEQFLAQNSKIEFNKAFELIAFASDDGGKLNQSSGFFRVDNGQEIKTIFPYKIDNSSGDYTKFYLNFTPKNSNNHTIEFLVKETNDAGAKLGKANRTLVIATKPDDIILAGGDIVTDKVNITDDFVLKIPINYIVSGVVDVYNLTVGVKSDLWQTQNVFYNVLPVKNSQINDFVYLTIPKNTQPQIVKLSKFINFTNPDKSLGYVSRDFDLEILPNHDFQIIAPQVYSLDHNSTENKILQIKSVGTGNSVLKIEALSDIFNVKFYKEGHFNPVSGIELLKGVSKNIDMRIVVPPFENQDEDVVINVSDDFGNWKSKVIKFDIVDENNFTTDKENIKINAVSGDNYLNDYISIQNNGNLPVDLSFNVEQDLLNPNLQFSIPSSKHLEPGETFRPLFNFTPQNSGEYVGNFVIQSSFKTIKIPVEISILGVEGHLVNISDNLEKLPGQTVGFVSYLYNAGEYITENVELLPTIGGEACQAVSSTPVQVDEGIYYLKGICEVPNLKDGLDYDFHLMMNYNHPSYGNILVSIAQTKKVSYKDTTAPEVTKVVFNDFKKNSEETVFVNIDDNVEILGNNYADYRVEMKIVNLKTEQSFVVNLDEPALDNLTLHKVNLKFDEVGDYTYQITVIDPDNNKRSYPAQRFVVYDFVSFFTDFKYVKDSISYSPNLEFDLHSKDKSYKKVVSTNHNSVLEETFRSGTYDFDIRDVDNFYTIKFIDFNTLLADTNNILEIEQMSQSELSKHTKSLNSGEDVENNFNGFYFKASQNLLFSVKYDYLNYVGEANNLNIYICSNYSREQKDCKGYWRRAGLLNLTQDVLEVSAPVELQKDTFSAIVFFEQFISGEPKADFSPDTIELAIEHNSTKQIALDISSVNYGSFGANLENIELSCYEAGSEDDFCSNFDIEKKMILEIPVGVSKRVYFNVKAKHNLPSRIYNGMIRYSSNLGVLEERIPVKINVLESPNFKINYNNSLEILGAKDSEILLDKLFIENKGNIDQIFEVSTLNDDFEILSNKSFKVLVDQNLEYNLKVKSNRFGAQTVPIKINNISISYPVNVKYGLEIVDYPENQIDFGDNISVDFNMLEYENGIFSPIEKSLPYFNIYSVKVQGVDCESNPREDLILYSDGPDKIKCKTPILFDERENYELELTLYKNDMKVQDRVNLSFKDVFPPQILNVSKKIVYDDFVFLEVHLKDKNFISDNFKFEVFDSSNQIVQSYSFLDPKVLVNDVDENNRVISLNFSLSNPQDYSLNFSYSDKLGNQDVKKFYFSYFPEVDFIASTNYGEGSSIVSSMIEKKLPSVLERIDDLEIEFLHPVSSEVLYKDDFNSQGKLDIFKVQNRSYDLRVKSDRASFLIRNVSYKGESLLSFQKIDVSKLADAKIGINFKSINFSNATLVFATDKIKSLHNGYFKRCSNWNFQSNVCQGNESIIKADNYIVDDNYFLYELTVDGFSSYTLFVPDSSGGGGSGGEGGGSSGGSGGGSSGGGSSAGGGGGASKSSIKQLLDEKIGNLSSVKSQKDDELKVDTSLIEQTLYTAESSIIYIDVKNNANESGVVKVDFTKELSDVISIEPLKLNLKPKESGKITVKLFAPVNANKSVYDGFININYANNVNTIPVKVRILSSPEKQPSLTSFIVTPSIKTDGSIKVEYDFNYPLRQAIPGFIYYKVYSTEFSEVVFSLEEDFILNNSFKWIKQIDFEKELKSGSYYLETKILYKNRDGKTHTLFVSKPFKVEEIWLNVKIFSLFGMALRVWHVLIVLICCIFMVYSYVWLKHYLESKKKFHMPVDFNKLPLQSDRNGYVGHVAETNHRAFVDFEALKMHTLVAGSTGGGKSFSAQVIIEEALIKNIGVVVFDPTAQWSGFLRKNEDEKLLKLYKKFGLDPKKDPRGFKGNIRRVTNPREIIKLEEYLKPGEITIIDCHKMTFDEIDKFVANTVSQVFMSELEESRSIRLLMVYDEVHRLLPKFGGSGAGYMQIERACREFRKWGIGLMMISQVLSDFMGETKANINTEIQMKTRDENDLQRLSLKYGEELLRSVVKAEIGTGMMQNSNYNKGRPYLVSFRPIYHSVERLTEKELVDYDNYNERLLNIRDSMRQISEIGEDIVDIEVEVDLAYNKLKESKFDVAQIYVEELESTLSRMWDKIGKQPKKREVPLIDEETLNRFIELAKAQHKKAVKVAEQVKESQSEETKSEGESQNLNKVDDEREKHVEKHIEESKLQHIQSQQKTLEQNQKLKKDDENLGKYPKDEVIDDVKRKKNVKEHLDLVSKNALESNQASEQNTKSQADEDLNVKYPKDEELDNPQREKSIQDKINEITNKYK